MRRIQKHTSNKESHLTNLVIKTIEKSSTIKERLSESFEVDSYYIDELSIKLKLEEWCQKSASGNESFFTNKILNEKLGMEHMKKGLCPVRLKSASDWPDWADMLWLIFQELDQRKTQDYYHGYLHHSGETLPSKLAYACEAMLTPFLFIAEKELEKEASENIHLLTVEALHNLMKQLLRDMNRIWQETLELEWSVYRAVQQTNVIIWENIHPSHFTSTLSYDNQVQVFVNQWFAGQHVRMLQDYPVLARLTAECVQRFIKGNVLFLQRLKEDWQEIQDFFFVGKTLSHVTNMEAGLSDPHQGGQTVHILTFATKDKIVYKPKSLEMDNAFYQLLEWFHQMGAPYKLRAMRSLHKGVYGWQTYVARQMYQTEVQERLFYSRAGALLCVLHLFGGTDFHYENMIPHYDHPVLIDLETFLTPQLIDNRGVKDNLLKKEESESLVKRELHSVMNTDFLPTWVHSKAGHDVNVGGIMAAVEQGVLPTSASEAKDSQQYDTNMLPAGEKLEAYTEELSLGFKEMYHFFLQMRSRLLDKESILSIFKDVPIRFVYRATRIYDRILHNSFRPDVLKDGIDRYIQLDTLSRSMLNRVGEGVSSEWHLIHKEIDDLWQMDIPYFSTISTSNSLHQVKDSQGLFSIHAYDNMYQKIKKMSLQDIEQQLSYIRSSMLKQEMKSHNN